MSVLNFRPVSPMLNCAVHLFCAQVWPQGFDLSETEAPDSLKRLKAEFASRGRITIYSGGSDGTIFDCPDTNRMFRAWHDWAHLHLDANFSLEGETRACELQCAQILARYGDGDTGQDMARVLRAEIIGQAQFWQRNRRYVTRQRAFTLAYLDNPAAALSGNF